MTTQKTTSTVKASAHEVQISLQNNIVPLHAALTAVLPAPELSYSELKMIKSLETSCRQIRNVSVENFKNTSHKDAIKLLGLMCSDFKLNQESINELTSKITRRAAENSRPEAGALAELDERLSQVRRTLNNFLNTLPKELKKTNRLYFAIIKL